MSEQKKVRCLSCNKEVDKEDINRWGDCGPCSAAERDTDMGVGDQGSR